MGGEGKGEERRGEERKEDGVRRKLRRLCQLLTLKVLMDKPAAIYISNEVNF